MPGRRLNRKNENKQKCVAGVCVVGGVVYFASHANTYEHKMAHSNTSVLFEALLSARRHGSAGVIRVSILDPLGVIRVI